MIITPTMTTSKSDSSNTNKNINYDEIVDNKFDNSKNISQINDDTSTSTILKVISRGCFHRLLFNKVQPAPSTTNAITTSTTNENSRINNDNEIDSNNDSSSSSSSSGTKESKSMKSDDTFDDIFLFNKPIIFFRMIEFQIMFTCLYMSLWSTNFITIVKENTSLTITEKWLSHIIMLIPIIISFNRVAYIAETYSLITSISDLNISAVYDVLVLSEQIHKISDEVRNKFQDKIKIWSGSMYPDKFQQAEFMKALFLEIDLDGSGSVDRSEFRVLLKKLNLTFSDFRFQLLCRAMSTICSHDKSINEAELSEFIFPGIKLPTSKEVRRHSISVLQLNFPMLLNNKNNDSSDSSDEENGNGRDSPVVDNNNNNNHKNDDNFPPEGDIALNNENINVNNNDDDGNNNGDNTGINDNNNCNNNYFNNNNNRKNNTPCSNDNSKEMNNGDMIDNAAAVDDAAAVVDKNDEIDDDDYDSDATISDMSNQNQSPVKMKEDNEEVGSEVSGFDDFSDFS
jgi:hypothetical protein